MSDKITIKKSHVFATLIVLVIVIAGFLVYSNWESLKPDKKVAMVNGQVIKMSEVERVIDAFKQQTGVEANESSAVEQLISRELLLEETENRGISVSENDVEEFLSEQLTTSGSNLEDFKAQVKASGGNYDELVGAYEEQLALQKLVEDLTLEEDLEISDEEASVFYEENAAIFASGGEDTSYDKVKDQIKDILLQQKQSELIGQLVEELRAEAEIKYY